MPGVERAAVRVHVGFANGDPCSSSSSFSSSTSASFESLVTSNGRGYAIRLLTAIRMTRGIDERTAG